MFQKLLIRVVVGVVVTATAHAQSSEPRPQETASAQLVQQADVAIAAKEYNKAIALLKQAGKLEPNDLDIQFKLATTLLAADRMPEMWYVLRKAAVRDPAHPDIARGLMSYWRMFDEQGLFNCRHETIDTVISVLGGPDRMVKGPDRTRYIWGFIALEVKHGQNTIHQTVDLRGLKPEHLKPVDSISIELDGRGRVVGHRTTNQNLTLAEFVLPGERVQNWTQLFSIQRLHGLARKKATVRQIAESMMTSLAKTNARRKYRLLEVSDSSVTFEWTAPATGKHKSQHELVRLSRGTVDVHRLAFVVRGTEQMNATLRKQWLGILSKAELKPVQTTEKQTGTTLTSQVLYMHGTKAGEITGAGEVWIAGDKVGEITHDGEIWVGGEKEGEITSDGEVWKAGDKIGDITQDGEIWRGGDQIGSIEKNGEVWLKGSNIGRTRGGSMRNAAIVLFYGFYHLRS